MRTYGLFSLLFCASIVMTSGCFAKNTAPLDPEKKPPAEAPAYYRPYLDLLEWTFSTMEESYYKPVSRTAYEAYVKRYKESILSKVPPLPRIDMVAWRGAGLLVYQLRDPADTFTNFIPPKEAEEYSKQIYGYENGIGVSGHLADARYLIDHVQLRSDAYAQGIRAGDLILSMNDRSIGTLTEQEIHDLLYPPLETVVTLTVLSPVQNATSSYTLTCREYFTETLTPVPTGADGVFCVRINQFNRMTADDLEQAIKDGLARGMKLFIIDLRDNPGGPPLAVHALSGFFLPAGSKLFYYLQRHKETTGLMTPPAQTHYTGPLVILVNKKSGSAAELMAATFKAYRRALVLGTDATAGMAFLKGTFKYTDGSMLAMLTGMSYLFDGTEMGFGGVAPQYTVTEQGDELVRTIARKFEKGTLFEEYRMP